MLAALLQTSFVFSVISFRQCIPVLSQAILALYDAVSSAIATPTNVSILREPSVADDAPTKTLIHSFVYLLS